MGRKPAYPEATEVNMAKVETMAAYGSTLPMIAAEFNICVGSLNNWRKAFPGVDEAYKRGRDKGSNRILQTAYKQAMDGNTTMLIFLMKTRLRMSERPVIDLSSDKLNKIIDVIIETVKDPEELKEIEKKLRDELDDIEEK